MSGSFFPSTTVFTVKNITNVITKFIIPDNIMKCDEHRASNFSRSGANVKGICNQMEHFNSEHEDSKVETIKKDVSTNHTPSDGPIDIPRKVYKLLQKLKSDFQIILVSFLGILPNFFFISLVELVV